MLQKDRFLTKAKRFKADSDTYYSYNNSLYKLYERFNLHNVEDFSNITTDDLEDWIEELSKGLRRSTINLIEEHCLEFFEYLLKKNVISFNPMKGIIRFNEREVIESSKEKYIPTIEEVEKIIKSVSIKEKTERGFEFTSARNKAILQLLATQGLRQSIIRNMRIDDIKRNDNQMVVIEITADRTKARIPHRICFSGKTKELFNAFLEVRNKYNIQSNLIFTSLRGGKLIRADIQDIFNKAVRKANIEVKKGIQFSPHCLRHFTATILVNNNENEILIKKILNWSTSDRDMLSRYSNHDNLYDEEKARATSFLG